MDTNVWIQLIITAGAIIGGMFVTIRYAIGQTNKKEKAFLEYLEKSQTQQLDYYTNKNGIIEKISKTFSSTINKNTRALDKLSARIKEKI